MSTILLASSGDIFKSKKVNFLFKDGLRWAWITTAGKAVPDTSYLDRDRINLKNKNVDFTEIDLAGKSLGELADLLKPFDVLFVEGGNTFYLLKAARESGFDKLAPKLVQQGKIYFGISAGSYLACPTIEMATWKDSDNYNRCGVADFKALRLVPFLVFVHYKPEYRELLEEKISTAGYPVKILTDDQAILIQNNRTKFLGIGEETRL